MKLFLLFLFFISTTYAEQWDCAATTNTGTFTLSSNCTISGNNHVAVANTLEIIGADTDMSNLVTITAAADKRHFYLNDANANLTLHYVKLVGGDVYCSNCDYPDNYGGSILIYEPNGGELNLYSSIVFNNKAMLGGGITAYGAGSTNKNAIMNIYNSIIQNNEATEDGGGIYIGSYAVATIYNTKIENNQASVWGGGIRIISSDVTMKNTIISNNNAGDDGGGLYISGDSTDTVILRQSSFINNDAYRGDEIYTARSPTISLINTYFNNTNNNNNIVESSLPSSSPTWNTCGKNNFPCDDGETCSADSNLSDKAVRCEAVITDTEWDCAATTNTGTFTRSTNCTISGSNHVDVSNTLEIIGKNNGSDTDMSNLVTITAATNNKRHFYVNGENANLTLRYVKLVGGDVSSSSYGGSISIGTKGGELNLYSSIVFNNKAYDGGGISAYGASSTDKNAIMNVYNSIIQNNEATNRGGGIHMWDAVGAIENTKIDNNQAGDDGGGMYIEYSDVTMKNTNISNNDAGGSGGGLYIRGSSTTVTLRQSSFINNDASINGDEIYTYFSPTISLINTYFNNPNNNNNIVEHSSGTPTWKTCSDNLCTEEPCSADSNFPGKAVRCEAVITDTCTVVITGTCNDEEKKQALIDKYKNISQVRCF